MAEETDVAAVGDALVAFALGAEDGLQHRSLRLDSRSPRSRGIHNRRLVVGHMLVDMAAWCTWHLVRAHSLYLVDMDKGVEAVVDGREVFAEEAVLRLVENAEGCGGVEVGIEAEVEIVGAVVLLVKEESVSPVGEVVAEDSVPRATLLVMVKTSPCSNLRLPLWTAQNKGCFLQ